MPLLSRILLALTLTVAASGSLRASDDPKPPKSDDPEAARKMDELLIRWEARNQTVRSLSIKFRRVDESALFNAKTSWEGQIRIQGPNRLYVDFYERQEGKPSGTFRERIVSDGTNSYQFLGPCQRVFVYPLEPAASHEILDRAPLPFLFGMTAAKIRERYEMTYVSEDAGTYTIRAVPKAKMPVDKDKASWPWKPLNLSKIIKSFSDPYEYCQILIKLDKERLFPVAIRLTAPVGTDTTTFTCSLSDVRENDPILPSWFDGTTMAEGLKKSAKWVVVANPGQVGQ